MRKLRVISWITILLLIVTVPHSSISEVTVDPFGIAIFSQSGETHETELTLTNHGEEEMGFNLRLLPQFQNDDNLRGGPYRDERGGPDDAGYEWRNDEEDDCPAYDWIDISDFEEVVDFEDMADDTLTGIGEFGFQLEYYGNEFEQIAIFPNGMAVLGEDPGTIVYFYPSGQWQEDLPTDYSDGGATPTPPPNLLCVAYQDLNPQGEDHGHIYFWSDGGMAVCTWQDVPHFQDAQVENDLWTFQIVIFASGLIKFQYAAIGMYDNEDIMIGFQNQDRDLGFTIMRDDFEYLQAEQVVAFGPESAWITWVAVDPLSGVIAGGEDAAVLITFNAEDIEAGFYYARLNIGFDDPDQPAIEIPLMMSVDSPVGGIEGTITNAANNEPVPDAHVVIEQFDFMRITDDEGNFEMTDIPVGGFDLTCTVTNYLPFMIEEIEVRDGEIVNGSMALLHAECNPSNDVREGIVIEIPTNSEETVEFTVSNDGNGDLIYEVERRLLGEANAEPWELRSSYPLGQNLQDSRLEGVIFDGENFYVSGANNWNNNDSSNTIYVLNRDKERIGSFNQPGDSRYGMRDLAWDGELIWGSGEEIIYGFTTEGQVIHRLEGPNDNNSALAWDPDHELLWVCTTTSRDIIGMNIEGRHVYTHEKGELRVYGLAYWPNDPDGYNLYIYNSPPDGSMQIDKMNPVNGDVVNVLELEPDVEGRASGAFITNQLDIYSWVLVSLVNDGGEDRLNIWQLEARDDWFTIDPDGGRIPAGESTDFVLGLFTHGLPAALFEAELVFIHNGVGGETHLPIWMTVTAEDNEPSSFNLVEPENGSAIYIEQVQTFTWEPSIDPDPEDEVSYLLWFRHDAGEFDSISVALVDTFMNVLPDTSFFNVALEAGFTWWVQALSGEYIVECNERFQFILRSESAEEEDNNLPTEFAIQAIYPNPFNAETRISYSLNAASFTHLEIYDFTGRHVANFAYGRQAAGYYRAVIDGSSFASGIYLIRLVAGEEIRTAKLVCIK
ncbi:T9SS type A sorting domain-containing protein [bacterium]|nr:T9SS type A sorting domain-containing protein [bacterium]